MNGRSMIRLLTFIGVCFFFEISDGHAQASQKDYYVVIGSFSKLDEAVTLTDEANLKGFSALYALHRKKKQYYVYLLQSSDQKKAKSFLDQIRKETEYKKAWLYKGKLGED
jgi:cell division septation protein DedD